MPQELIWNQHPQEAKEHRSLFPFKVSSGGIKRHSLTTRSQTGEVSINVNLAALADVLLQFATTLATRFPRLKGRPRKAGSSPLGPSLRLQGTPSLQTHTATHTKAQHPPQCRMGRRVFEVVSLQAAQYSFVAWCIQMQLGAERELLMFSGEWWIFYTRNPKCFAIRVLLTKPLSHTTMFPAERLILLFVFCLKVKQHQIPWRTGSAVCPGRPPTRCRF